MGMWCVLGCWFVMLSVVAQDPASSATATNEPAKVPAQPQSISAKPATPSGPKGTNAPYKIPENRIINFTVPLTPAARIALLNTQNPVVDYAKVAIAVPRGFDPEIPTPILLINGTSDDPGTTIRLMPAFTNVALGLGWIVIAADGPFGKPPQDDTRWRWAMISSLLDHINKAWPGAKRWPMVAGGISGGGKWAGVIGAILAQKDYNLIGVFMGAVNQDYATEAAKLYDPAIKYHQVPIYLSSGTDDKVATPEQHQQVKESLLSSGFTNVRLEHFKGGHALSEAELRKALDWFIDLYGKGSTPEAKGGETTK